jgi:hypothetical protein
VLHSNYRAPILSRLCSLKSVELMNKRLRNIVGILGVLLFPLAFIFWYRLPDGCGSAPLTLFCLWFVFTGSALLIPVAIAVSNLVSLLMRRDIRALFWAVFPLLVLSLSWRYRIELAIVREVYTYETRHDDLEAFLTRMPDPCEHRTRHYNFPRDLRSVSND